ncbi:RICIN domain-containing protein, partial [Streptomyces sp. SID5643]|uniref:RICIN domain-containing protein n=1 Tax=Streptomyces sp. SID5643 TaxID=2690307 RepID=UPI00136B8C7A
ALRSSRALLSGVGAVSAGVLATVLIISASSHDGGEADPTGSNSAAGGKGPTSVTPPGTAGLPSAAGVTRLRNAGADLCLDIRDLPKEGSGAKLAQCSTVWTQQWTYEKDGLLRSVADPGLCLDSHKDAGVVVLGTCAAEDAERGGDVRYDLTVQGELLPRWDERLALAPAGDDPDADIVVKVRDRSSDAQRWRPEPLPTTEGSLSIEEQDDPAARQVTLTDGRTA